MAGAGLICVLAFAPARVEAQAVDDADANFDQRFAIDGRIAPTFTRPEVIDLLSNSGAWLAADEAASKELALDAPGGPPPLGQIIMAEPKGPAKVLKDLLDTPVKELLVSRAEAGPEVPPVAAPDVATTASRGAAPDTASVPARAADPVAERPAPQDVASMPAPAQAAPPRQETTPSGLDRMAAASPPSAEIAAAPDGKPEPHGTAEGQASAERAGRALGSGRAAWYQHAGRTASGEKFNPNDLTAAHRTLPFGTQVRVVNERTGRSVVVRINDRISLKALRRQAGLVIDLSRAGGKAIGLIGVGRVSLYQVQGPKIAQAEPQTTPAVQHAAPRMVAGPSRDRARARLPARSASKVKLGHVTRKVQRVATQAKSTIGKGVTRVGRPVTHAGRPVTRAGRPPIAAYRLQGAKRGVATLRVRS